MDTTVPVQVMLDCKRLETHSPKARALRKLEVRNRIVARRLDIATESAKTLTDFGEDFEVCVRQVAALQDQLAMNLDGVRNHASQLQKEPNSTSDRHELHSRSPGLVSSSTACN